MVPQHAATALLPYMQSFVLICLDFVALDTSAASTLQHAATALLRHMLAVLDLAADTGTASDRHAADRLQRRCACGTF